MSYLTIRNGSITFNPDGSIMAKGDEIDLKNKEVGEELESVGVKEEDAYLSFDQKEKKAEEDKGKKVEREQFGWWLVALIILIGFILIRIYKIKI